MNSPEGKAILALVRCGDFAHAGEEEAIRIAMAGVLPDPARRVVDAGCGRGGTADYLIRHGLGRVTAFDIDGESVHHAAERYPAVDFHVADAGSVDRAIPGPFDLVTCFNSFYAFPQEEALAALRRLAATGARLLIFDYTDPAERFAGSDFAHLEDNGLWRPVHPGKLRSMALDAGWELTGWDDLTDRYVGWYDELLANMERHREAVITSHGEEAFEFVRTFYRALHDALANGVLGGGCFRLVAVAG
ncbi:MAG: methyltransferase domain-containing protein [Chthoniobacterales bacterium]|nr:methyltransferase domain-containing protein [Chthoniobacterales bacterium]